MQRRQLIYYLSLLALTSAVVGTGIPKQAPQPDATISSQVIIIGAGMAGLSAGRFLQSQGIQPLILEARSRLGGRIWTDRSLGIPLDLGAAWIHTPDGNPISDLDNQVGAKTFETDEESLVTFDLQGRKLSDEVVTALETEYTDLLGQIETLLTNIPGDISIREAIGRINPQFLQNPAMQYHLSSSLEFTTGGAIDRLSARSWNSDREFTGADVILPNGYDQLVNWLAEGLNIQTGQVVQKVIYDRPTVQITTNQGQFTAEQVIITVPLGVLKQKSIDWQPALPENFTRSIDKVGMGVVNKVALLFPRAFWDREVQYYGFHSPVMGKYNFFLSALPFSGVNALVTFALGNYGAVLERQSPAQVQAEVMEHLKLMFGRSIPEPTQMLSTRWGSDPFSRGAYSYPQAGVTNQDFQALGAVVNDQLFFAGEHTHPDYRASVHGAYLSGQRAAQQVLDSLG